MKVKLTKKGGQIELSRSHIDKGWIAKWGIADVCINFFTVGYINAMFSVASGLPSQSFKIEELSSIVSGSDTSNFLVEKQ